MQVQTLTEMSKLVMVPPQDQLLGSRAATSSLAERGRDSTKSRLGVEETGAQLPPAPRVL